MNSRHLNANVTDITPKRRCPVTRVARTADWAEGVMRHLCPSANQQNPVKPADLRLRLNPPTRYVLSPTTRRSIALIRSERSTSAALMAAIVCRNVLTFDPSDTIPASTMAIDPMAAT